MASPKMPGEFQLIQHIQTTLAPMTRMAGGEDQVILGIGDDCAVLQGAGGKYLLVTTDMLVEEVHFSRMYSSLREIGQKAIIVNVSDIAAMGGEPKFAFISLALPSSFSMEEFDELWQGLVEMARKYSLLILGGDTNASFPQAEERGLVINITLLGEVWPHELISRQGARPGDLILLTGQIGDSAAGLDLLQSIERFSGPGGGSPGLQDSQYFQVGQYQQALQRHRVPVVRLAESRIISQNRLATAMIDVSDGVAGDLRHLCNQGLAGSPIHCNQDLHQCHTIHQGHQGRQGGVGAVLWSDRLPISGAVIEISRLLQRPALSYALCGGEDYELLFTVPPDLADKARQMIEEGTGTPVSIIGEITEDAKGVYLIDAHGQAVPIPQSGFDHFRKKEENNSCYGRFKKAT